MIWRAFYGICLASAICASAWAQTVDRVRIAVGHADKILLRENPSTGYTWKVDETASAGLDLLTVTDHGHIRGGSAPGSPGVRHWSLRARHAGHARIVFVYQRPWEPKPVEIRSIDVEIR
jgi:inhibitor of cysteine peptidase